MFLISCCLLLPDWTSAFKRFACDLASWILTSVLFYSYLMILMVFWVSASCYLADSRACFNCFSWSAELVDWNFLIASSVDRISSPLLWKSICFWPWWLLSFLTLCSNDCYSSCSAFSFVIMFSSLYLSFASSDSKLLTSSSYFIFCLLNCSISLSIYFLSLFCSLAANFYC